MATEIRKNIKKIIFRPRWLAIYICADAELVKGCIAHKTLSHILVSSCHYPSWCKPQHLVLHSCFGSLENYKQGFWWLMETFRSTFIGLILSDSIVYYPLYSEVHLLQIESWYAVNNADFTNLIQLSRCVTWTNSWCSCLLILAELQGNVLLRKCRNWVWHCRALYMVNDWIQIVDIFIGIAVTSFID